MQRLLLSLAANSYVRFLSGLACVDCTSGFRAYRVDALKKVAFDRISSTGYAFLPELLFALDQVKVAEVPICYTERRVGQSKMGTQVIAEAIVATLGAPRPQGRPSHQSPVSSKSCTGSPSQRASVINRSPGE